MGNIAAFSPVTQNGQTSDATVLMAYLNSIRNEFNGEIENVNIKSTAAIVASKLNLAAMHLENLVKNGDFEQWNGGAAVAPDEWDLEGTPTVARDTATQGYGSYAAKLTCAGATDEGLKQTLTNLKASTSYRVTVKGKATSGDTLELVTTGATTNIAGSTASTTLVDVTGIFITDGSGTDVVIKVHGNADGDIVYVESVMCHEGSVRAGFIQSPEYLTPTRMSHSVGYHKNLIIKRASVATVDIDADSLMVDGYLLSAVDLTVNLATTGANALDTGAEAISTAYYLWVIYNSSTATTAGLISASSSAPTLPSGYTNKRLVGYAYNDASGHVLDFYQYNEDYHWAAAVLILNNGSAATWTAVAHNYSCPSIAKIARINVYAVGTATIQGGVVLGWKTALTHTKGLVYYASTGDAAPFIASIEMPNADTNVYYNAHANIDVDLYVQGFRFPL